MRRDALRITIVAVVLLGLAGTWLLIGPNRAGAG